MSYKPYILEPRDSVVVRDGRPFDGTPGIRARTLPFPMPQTVAGQMRTRAGSNSQGVFSQSPQEVLQLGLRGPLLYDLKHQSVLAAAPADALMLQSSDSQYRLYALSPVLRGPALLDEGLDQLHPVGSGALLKDKPKGMPAFWHWPQMLQWLQVQPTLYNSQGVVCNPSELGIPALPTDVRSHVSINAAAQTALEGALFSTVGLVFAHMQRPLGLLLETDAGFDSGLSPFDFLGGERRMVHWRLAASGLPAANTPQVQHIAQQVAKHGHCRVVLLTPAYFEQGHRPTWLLNQGVTATLQAVASQRPQVVSGWDLQHGHAKPTRRLVPAGSVLYLRLQSQDAAAIEAWVKAIWMQNVSDDDQDRRNGLGLAAVGVWDGQLQPMEVSHAP